MDATERAIIERMYHGLALLLVDNTDYEDRPGYRRASPGKETPSQDYFTFMARAEEQRLDKRYRHFPKDFCEGPGWCMILDLFQAWLRNVEFSVTSTCIASRKPTTTALRWIDSMVEEGMISRRPCESDSRVSYLTLTPDAIQRMKTYLVDIGPLQVPMG